MRLNYITTMQTSVEWVRIPTGAIRTCLRRLKLFTSDFLMDHFYGLETRRVLSNEELGTAPSIANHYEATDWFSLKNVLRELEIGPEDTFLDIGCGKGRALLAASGFPFRRIIGIDLSPSLCAIAERNAASYLHRACRRTRCRDIQVQCIDARVYDIPADVTCIFLFNSLPAPVLGEVLDRLRASASIAPRKILLIYQNAVLHDQIAALPDLQERPVIPDRYRSWRMYEWLQATPKESA